MNEEQILQEPQGNGVLPCVSGSYIITDEIPKEGDYGINPANKKKNKPRLVERASETNDTLGFKQPKSWFTWQPLRDYHRKVVFE